MANTNNMKWFTHDTDAHEDQFIDGAIEKFGPFGYMAYFMILELMAKEGAGDILTIQVPRLCKKLRCRTKQLTEFLDYCSTKDELKVNYSSTKDQLKSNYSSTSVQLQNKKFSERQKKMKRGVIFNAKSVRVEKEIEIDREKENRLSKPAASTPSVPVVVKNVVPKAKTPVQRVVEAYKHAKGVPMDDKGWDRANFGRYSKAAKSLLTCFAQDVDKSAAYIFLRAEDLNASDLDWTLETITRHAYDGIGIPKKEENHGPQYGAVGADRLDGQRRIGGTASSRDTARDAIKAIGATQVRVAKEAELGAHRPDLGSDGEEVS